MIYAYFAGGCFWCITPVFAAEPGVIYVVSGYCGGDEEDPTYEDVKAQRTGHRETVRIEYDADLIGYSSLLSLFLGSVDVEDGGGQFIDRGRSYTLAVYYTNDEEKRSAEDALAALRETHCSVCVSVEPYKKFFAA
jgi:methionine-S-sulfoxide reductase